MKKFVTGAVVAASLVGGSAAIAAINPLGIASAQDPGSTTTAPATTPAPPTTAAPKSDPGGPDRKERGGEAMGGVLDELVKDGTINQEQADKIKAKLKEKATANGREGSNRHGGPHRAPGAGLDDAAKSLGMTTDELKTSLKAGKSIAQVAGEKGVAVDKVVADLTSAANKRIDDAVAAGKIPADKAAKAKEGIAERITKMVNSVPGEGKPKPR